MWIGQHLECRITPASGRVCAQQIKSWEIRDMVPALWRLARNGVDFRVYFRTWDKLDTMALPSNPFAPAPVPDVDDPTTVETAIDVTNCIPFNSMFTHDQPTDNDRARAHYILRQGFNKCLPTREPFLKHDAFFASRSDIELFHRIKFYDALVDFSRRLFPRTGKIYVHTGVLRNANHPARYRRQNTRLVNAASIALHCG